MKEVEQFLSDHQNYRQQQSLYATFNTEHSPAITEISLRRFETIFKEFGIFIYFFVPFLHWDRYKTNTKLSSRFIIWNFIFFGCWWRWVYFSFDYGPQKKYFFDIIINERERTLLYYFNNNTDTETIQLN